MKIGGLQKFSLIDYPDKFSCIIFTQGCNFRCPWCFTGNNKVLTDKGLFKIKDIVEEHIKCKVYDYDGKFSPIKKYYKRETNSLLEIRVFSHSDIISCTPNHEFFVYNLNTNTIIKKEAQHINIKEDYLVIPIPRGKIFNYKLDVSKAIKDFYQTSVFKQRFNNEKIIEKIKELRKEGFSWRKIFKKFGLTDHIRRVIEKEEVLDGKILPIVKEKEGKVAVKGSNFFIDKFIKITPNFMRLVGYYLSEGCSSKHKRRKNSYRISFTFNPEERECIEDTKKIFFETFKTELKEVKSKRYKAVDLACDRGIIGLFFKYYFGGNVYNKKIPIEFLYLDKNLQKQLIIGLFRGDGISSHGYIRKYQKQRIQITSKVLLYQISLILLRLGIKHSIFRKEIIIAEKKNFNILGQKHLISKKSIDISKRYGFTDNRYLYLKIKSINKRKRKETVYNLEIDNVSHSYNVNLISVSNCHNPELVYPHLFKNTISENYVLSFLESRKNELEAIVITGGEPTIQPDLAEFVEKIKKTGYLIKLDTNGSNPYILEKLLKNKLVDYIAMDIKAPPEKYSLLTGKNIDISLIFKSMEIIEKYSPDYEFRTTFVPSLLSEDDITKIKRMIKNKEKYRIQKFKEVSKV
ncbi:MAG: anaerobic ribonucleoside-triphosphate reductase activating protein [Candidatus Omnitrophica bacterium 4484_70.1]|nr:MAG: anaerobic ribonucleoside-triphosphate reductase activating protein [Candidatus Omnitrophica bacterium 4484_70.1]